MKRLLVILGSLVVAVAIAFGVLFLVTGGDHLVLATTADDPALPRIEIDGYAFHGESYGNPNDQTLIVLHGGPGGDYRSLRRLQDLAEDGYEVVFYDQRGSGLSPRVGADELTIAQFVDDLDAIVDAYSDGAPVVLVGHSWGAMLAALYMGAAPEKIDRAVLIEPGFFDAEEADIWQARSNSYLSGLRFYWQATLAWFESLHVGGPDAEAAGDHFMGRILGYFENHPDNPYHCPGEDYDAPYWRFGALASNTMQGNATDADFDSIGEGARAFDGAVLLVAGACDSWIGPDLQAEHAGYFDNARLEVIPDAGHDSIWDSPDATLAVIRSFLGEG